MNYRDFSYSHNNTWGEKSKIHQKSSPSFTKYSQKIWATFI